MSSDQPNPPAMSTDPARKCPGVMRLMRQRRIVRSAFKVSVVVGTALNVINHGQYLYSWNLENVNLWRAALNFVVPYLVSSYSAARYEAQRAIGEL